MTTPAEIVDAALALLDARLAELVGAVGAGEDGRWPGLVLTEDEVQSALLGVTASPFSIVEQLRARGGDLGPLGALAERFGLTDLEVDAVLACAAIELAPRYGRAFAYLNDDLTRPHATPTMLLALFGRTTADRIHFVDGARLFATALLSRLPANPDGGSSLMRGLVVDESVVRFLLGQPFVHPALHAVSGRPRASERAADLWSAFGPRGRLEQLLETLVAGDLQSAPLVAALVGRPGSGRRHAYGALVADRGLLPIPPVDCRALVDRADGEQVVRILFRDAALACCPVYLHAAEALNRAAPALRQTLLDCIARYGWLVFLAFDDLRGAADRALLDGAVAIRIPTPDLATREAAWRRALDDEPLDAIGDLAAKFALTMGQIAAAVEGARLERTFASDGTAWADILHAHAARVSAPALGRLGERIEPCAGIEDIVLPTTSRGLLQDLIRHVRHRGTVRDDWRFGSRGRRGQGLHALFAGPPGTGKTMAAEVIARELGMELYRIDLSQVVSKYIGETEKNLAAIFAEAEGSNAILFFDEADALFGRRSETKDAHDRYANIEVNYLLQAIESYDGVSILATNFRQNVDPAFIRRMRLILEFPLPGAPERREIWARLFPTAAPVDQLDLDFLANAFDFSGGSIQNVGLTAAYLAAEAKEKIGMPHVVRAAQRELQKLGHRFVVQQFAPYDQWLDRANGVSPVQN